MKIKVRHQFRKKNIRLFSKKVVWILIILVWNGIQSMFCYCAFCSFFFDKKNTHKWHITSTLRIRYFIVNHYGDKKLNTNLHIVIQLQSACFDCENESICLNEWTAVISMDVKWLEHISWFDICLFRIKLNTHLITIFIWFVTSTLWTTKKKS